MPNSNGPQVDWAHLRTRSDVLTDPRQLSHALASLVHAKTHTEALSGIRIVSSVVTDDCRGTLFEAALPVCHVCTMAFSDASDEAKKEILYLFADILTFDPDESEIVAGNTGLKAQCAQEIANIRVQIYACLKSTNRDVRLRALDALRLLPFVDGYNGLIEELVAAAHQMKNIETELDILYKIDATLLRAGKVLGGRAR